jgi:hypothetical protein
MECGIRQREWKIVQSITAMRFCKSEHPAAQHNFSRRHQSSHNPPLHSASYWTLAVTNAARRGRNHHHLRMALRADTNECRRRVAHNMAKCIQITRVTSANMTHLTKISAVIRKQLPSDTIDPHFYGTHGLAVPRRSHGGKSIQI